MLARTRRCKWGQNPHDRHCIARLSTPQHKVAQYGDLNRLDKEMLFDLIEQQCEDGISFMAIHCGINLYTIERLEKQGSVTAAW